MSAEPKYKVATAVPMEEVEKSYGESSGVSTRAPSAKDEAQSDQEASAARHYAQSASDDSPVEKTKSKASVNDVSSIPNGGLLAWLQVAGAFSLFLNTWGVLNTFGAYQTYYEQIHLETSSNISWIGSIQSFLLLLVGAATGPVYDAGYFRTLLFTGSFMVVFGHMMLSLVKEYWQAMLAQAFCVGIGAGCLFVPSVAVLSTYFNTRISTVMGIAASGSSLGGVIYPIMFYKLIPQVGFGWTVRIIGFTILATLAVPCTVMRMRVKPAAKRKLVDTSAFKEMPYTIFCLACFLGFMGLYILFFYVSYYGVAGHIADANLSFYFLPMLNAGSVFGRILPNIVADRVGTLNMMFPSALISGLLTFCMIAAHAKGSVIVIAILYGFFSGTFVSLPPSILVILTPPDKRGMIGTRVGMCFTLTSFGVLIGAPVAGAILGSKNDFTGTFAFGGTMCSVGGIFFFLARMFKANWKIVAKV